MKNLFMEERNLFGRLVTTILPRKDISENMKNLFLEERKEGYLRKHEESVHGGKKFACNTCDNQFSHKRDVMKHKQSVHV